MDQCNFFYFEGIPNGIFMASYAHKLKCTAMKTALIWKSEMVTDLFGLVKNFKGFIQGAKWTLLCIQTAVPKDFSQKWIFCLEFDFEKEGTKVQILGQGVP